MRRRVLRPSFVVTFALGAAANAGGCGGKDSPSVFTISSNNPPGLSPDASAGCPAEEPATGAPCDLPSYASCPYNCVAAVCEQGKWSVGGGCNPPSPVYEAGPDVYDAARDATSSDAAASDGGPDGEGQDGGRVADASGDVSPDVESE